MPFHTSFSGRVKWGTVAQRADARKPNRLEDDQAVAMHGLEPACT